ncbi:MAG: gliding motility lipoprotein GldH [Cyclobacteriaceae bacterium]|nr:gliding motility lipoprotein GldH [Cyclobacteriaceae bacterium]
MNRCSLFFLLLPVLWSCAGDRLYEAKEDFDKGNWSVSQEVQFEFEIKSDEIAYDLHLSLRHDLDYPFHNLYFKYQLYDQDENVLKERLVNLDLFNPKTGSPIGSGIGIYRDLETLIEEGISFKSVGNYKVTLVHYMRPEILQGIHSIGIKLKENQKSKR